MQCTQNDIHKCYYWMHQWNSWFTTTKSTLFPPIFFLSSWFWILCVVFSPTSVNFHFIGKSWQQNKGFNYMGVFVFQGMNSKWQVSIPTQKRIKHERRYCIRTDKTVAALITTTISRVRRWAKKNVHVFFSLFIASVQHERWKLIWIEFIETVAWLKRILCHRWIPIWIEYYVLLSVCFPIEMKDTASLVWISEPRRHLENRLAAFSHSLTLSFCRCVCDMCYMNYVIIYVTLKWTTMTCRRVRDCSPRNGTVQN